jgi:hypothetical protein
MMSAIDFRLRLDFADEHLRPVTTRQFIFSIHQYFFMNKPLSLFYLFTYGNEAHGLRFSANGFALR